MFSYVLNVVKSYHKAYNYFCLHGLFILGKKISCKGSSMKIFSNSLDLKKLKWSFFHVIGQFNEELTKFVNYQVVWVKRPTSKL